MTSAEPTSQPLAGGSEHPRFGPWTLIGAAVVALYLLPQYVANTYLLHMLILISINVSVGSAWNVIGGFAGQYSIGHAAYFGVGAYTVMILLQSRQVAPWWGIWAGVLASLVVALLIGAICFRLRGPYFVLASIAVTEIVRVSALNLKELTNGAEGILVIDIPPLVIGGHQVTNWMSKVPYYYIGLSLAFVTIAVSIVVRNSKLGYYLQAIREDQDAAHSLGINLSIYKNLALALSAVFTSIAGSLYAVYVGFIDPSTVLGLDLSVQIVMICLIGGIGTISGPVIGALLLVPLSEALRSNMITNAFIDWGIVAEGSAVGRFMREQLAQAHVLIYGILVVIVILFMPQGVVGFARKMWARKGGR